jgi:hypothetical protein
LCIPRPVQHFVNVIANVKDNEGESIGSNSGPPESVGDLLDRYSEGMIAKSQLRTLGVRLSEEDHIHLELIVAHYGVPKATFARDLMSAALSEAMDSMRFENEDDQMKFQVEYDERIMELPIEKVHAPIIAPGTS